MSRPLAFLDVDGCILVDPGTAPSGYVTAHLRKSTYAYNPKIGKWLRRLADCYDLVWSSHGWRGREDKDLSPLFGLPAGLGQLRFNAPDPSDGDMNPGKLKAIEQHAGDEPCCILDDRQGPAVVEWAMNRTVLLIRPDPTEGLTERQVLVMEAFAKAMALGIWPIKGSDAA